MIVKNDIQIKDIRIDTEGRGIVFNTENATIVNMNLFTKRHRSQDLDTKVSPIPQKSKIEETRNNTKNNDEFTNKNNEG